MQETQTPEGTLHRELFIAKSDAEAKKQMDDRLRELSRAGHKLVRRVTIEAVTSIATTNRHTGKPHENRREIERRQRQMARA